MDYDLTILKKVVERHTMSYSSALELLIASEGWRCMAPYHEKEVSAFWECENGTIVNHARHIRESAAKGELLLPPEQKYETSEESSSRFTADSIIDDDVAFMVKKGWWAAERNPIVSYWVFVMATHTGLKSGHREGFLFWMSYTAAVICLARRRSALVRRAIISVLHHFSKKSEYPEYLVATAALISIELELDQHQGRSIDQFKRECDLLTSILITVDPLYSDIPGHHYIEPNGDQIARTAYALLYTMDSDDSKSERE